MKNRKKVLCSLVAFLLALVLLPVADLQKGSTVFPEAGVRNHVAGNHAIFSEESMLRNIAVCRAADTADLPESEVLRGILDEMEAPSSSENIQIGDVEPDDAGNAQTDNTQSADDTSQADGEQQTDAEQQSGEEGQTVAAIPTDHQYPLLVDAANLLTEEEASDLLAKLTEISERQKCDVAIVTLQSLQGGDIEAVADDFYDYGGFGYGEKDDGILLLLSMEEREWAMTTHEFGNIAFTDAGREAIEEEFISYLKSGDYAGGFTVFAEECDRFLTRAYEGDPYDSHNLNEMTPQQKSSALKLWGIADAILALLGTNLVAGAKKKAMLTVKRQPGAQNYTKDAEILYANDRFIRSERSVQAVAPPPSQSSSSSSGRTRPRGTTTHHSSSGRTHGGSHGKF